jgi:hypothetical protein
MAVSNTYYNPTTKKTETLWQVPDKPVEVPGFPGEKMFDPVKGYSKRLITVDPGQSAPGGVEGVDWARMTGIAYGGQYTARDDPYYVYKEDVQKSYDPQRVILSGMPLTEDFYSGKARAAMLAKQEAGKESELARKLEGQFRTSDSASVTTPGGYWGTEHQSKKEWNPFIYGGMVEASRYEKDIKNKMAEEESVYDKAYGDTLTAQEMARTGRGEIKAGSAAQQALVGGTGAGVAKAGKFKNLTELGSLLPASWMARKLDPSKIASQLSGIADRESGVTGEFKSEYIPAAQAQAQADAEAKRVANMQRGFGNFFIPTPKVKAENVGYTFARSKFTAPTVKKTGLGKYATISNLTPPASSPQNYFSGGSSRFDEKTGKYL